jgi:hypothetical protein
MGKPAWVKKGRDLANHFVDVIDSNSAGSSEVHVVLYRFDVPNSLKERTQQKRQGVNKAVANKIAADAVIDRIAMKDLLSCNESKEAVVTFFALHLIKCKIGSQITYVATSKGDCLASNGLTVQHL